MRDNRSNKGEIYQGSDKSGKPSGNTAIGMDFDVSSFVSILRQPKTPRLGEGATILRIDVNMNTVELLDDITDSEWGQISQAASPNDLRCRNNPVFFQLFSCGA